MRLSNKRRFIEKGLKKEYFAHEVFHLKKQYPDTFLLMEKRGFPKGIIMGSRHFQINVYASDIMNFPDDLLFHDKIMWHQQQLGKRGLIACAGVTINEDVAYISIVQADLVQQISKHEDYKQKYKSKIDNRFGHWYIVLYNAILDFLFEQNVRIVYFPTGEHIITHVKKKVDTSLFLRVYDSIGERFECKKVRLYNGEYWELDIGSNMSKVALLDKKTDSPTKTICISHDIEENLGHDYIVIPDKDCRTYLKMTLEIERNHGIRSTYNIMGTLFHKAKIVRQFDEHSIAFHTYDHVKNDINQLERARRVDLQVKGYRTSNSIITPELTDFNLSKNNFEWLMSSHNSFGFSGIYLENGIVKIPVHFDDSKINKKEMDYNQWEETLLNMAQQQDFISFGLHDCYSYFWIDRYDALLRKLKDIGDIVTCDDIINDVFLGGEYG